MSEENNNNNTTNNKTTTMWEESPGQTSAMRFMLIIGGLSIIGIWGFAAIYATLHGTQIPDIPTQVAICFSALIGGHVCNKIWGE